MIVLVFILHLYLNLKISDTLYYPEWSEEPHAADTRYFLCCLEVNIDSTYGVWTMEYLGRFQVLSTIIISPTIQILTSDVGMYLTLR